MVLIKKPADVRQRLVGSFQKKLPASMHQFLENNCIQLNWDTFQYILK